MSNMGTNKLSDAWKVQVNVIHALMIRELNTRFGRENIGFLWIMAEPLMFAGLVAVMWSYLKGPSEHGMNIVGFVVSGYIPITLLRHGIARSVAIFTANGSLLYHRQVKITDLIFARFLIEVLGCMMAYLFAACVLIPFSLFPLPSDIGLFLLGWFSYSAFCLGIFLIIAPVSEMSEVVEKFVPVTTYVMIPFSGLFTMASWMAPDIREYYLMIPLVNSMEMMRKGLWGDQITAYYDVWNPISWAVALSAIGFLLCRRVRRTLSVE